MIKIVKSGTYSSIQDGGRFGYRHMGVPVSGFMDSASAQLANGLLGRVLDTALIEMAYAGTQIRFIEDHQIVLTGAQIEAHLSGVPVPLNKVINVSAGSDLVIHKIKTGVWSYLGVNGRLSMPEVLGSQSQYAQITTAPFLHKGDLIKITKEGGPINSNSRLKIQTNTASSQIIKVVPGPEFHMLPVSSQEGLSEMAFKIGAQSNRMAYQLAHELIPHEHTMLTAPVIPGTIQWTAEGRFMVLMKDAQTTGGYPRVLQVANDSLDQLSQISVGKTLIFKLIL